MSTEQLQQNDAGRAASKPMPFIEMVEDVKTYDPKDDLIRTRNIRASIANHFGQRGVPADVREATLLLDTLKAMDASALGQMRVKVDEKIADLGAQQRLAAIAVLQYVKERRDNGEELEVAVPVNKEPPTLDDSIVTRDFVPGEDKVGQINQTFEEFQAATGKNIELAKEDADD